MRLLFIHQNLPAQFRHLLRTLAPLEQVEVIGIRQGEAPAFEWPARFPLLRYRPPPGANEKTHYYLRGFEEQLRRGQILARIGLDLKKQGFRPDWIVVHPGWGESLFLRDVFPDARIVSFFEFYYAASGRDVGFDPEFPPDPDAPYRLRIKNSHLLHDLVASDELLAPTRWQAEQLPAPFRDKLRVLHDGIRTDLCRPDPDASFQLADGRRLDRRQRIITYVARGLEPYRGFHVFMRALPEILRADPEVQVLVAGTDEVCYGTPAPAPHAHYRDYLLATLGDRLDRQRVHFVGRLPYAAYLQLLQVSSLHIYLTYPFVLSWSLLEAMATGCQILASDTAPVRELIRDGQEGRLVDFFAVDALAASAITMLRQPDANLGKAARARIVAEYDYETVIRPRWLTWLGLA